MTRFFVTMCALVFGMLNVASAETVVDASQRQGVTLTVYGNGLGLVQDDRTVTLPPGIEVMALEDVATQIIPESLMLAADGLSVLERRFDFDLLTPQALLEHSVGKSVFFLRTNEQTGQDQMVKATILSTAGGLVIERDGRIETNPPGRLILDTLPDGLRARPALLASVRSTAQQDQAFDLAMGYLSGGLSWNTDYVARLSEDETSLNLSALASLTNTSGAAFMNASVRLVAGEVNRQSMPKGVQPEMMRAMAMDTAMAASAPAPAPTSVGNLYVYPLKGLLSLGEQQTRQVPLLDPVDVDVLRTHVFRNTVHGRSGRVGSGRGRADRQHARIELAFDNTLDVPLPGGLVRLYTSPDGAPLTFLGEDRINDTPTGAQILLNPGKSFDVTAQRVRTAYETIGLSSGGFEAAYSITLTNAGARPAAVRWEESIGGDWEVLEESLPHDSKDANRVIWKLDIPAGGEQTLTFRVRSQR